MATLQSSLKKIFVGILLCLLALSGCDGIAPTGDYGDAPDGDSTGYPSLFAQTGMFPTLFSSDGARTLSIDEATLGPSASIEVDADDPADPDGVPNLTNNDSDDGLVDLFITLTQIPPPAIMSVNVSYPSAGPGGTFYLNALIDLNMDGKWGGATAGGEPEWVVQNYAVPVVSSDNMTITPPAFAFSNGNRLPDGAWMRIALTKEMVTATDWDGSGEFSSGEIEDHVIELPDTGDKEIPILSVDCDGPYTFGANNQINVQCVVTNLHPTVGGNFTYQLDHTGTGTVDVGNCLPPGPVFVAAADNVQIDCTAIKGVLPDQWRLTTKVEDPVAVLVDGGIQIGHSDESYSDMDFTGSEEKQLQAFVNSLELSFEHFTGYSHVLVFGSVYFDDPEPLAGAQVTLAMTGQSSDTSTAVTDANGDFSATFVINQYGTYTVEVTDITGENVEYASENNVITSATVEVK